MDRLAPSDFARRLRARERLLGTLIGAASPRTVAAIAAAGWDWVFLAGEHGEVTADTVAALVAAVPPEVATLVRVPTLESLLRSAALAAGAAGIVVPLVHDAGHAADAVRAVRGDRDDALVVVQAESAEAVANAEAIVRVPGVDAVFIGPHDLSASLGVPEQFDAPEFLMAVAALLAAGTEAGMPMGYFGRTFERVRLGARGGATLLLAGTDTVVVAAAATAFRSRATDVLGA